MNTFTLDGPDLERLADAALHAVVTGRPLYLAVDGTRVGYGMPGERITYAEGQTAAAPTPIPTPPRSAYADQVCGQCGTRLVWGSVYYRHADPATADDHPAWPAGPWRTEWDSEGHR